jgi:hypothetical protein
MGQTIERLASCALTNGRIIAENVLHEQRKIVKYNQLVANMIILHNVERMTRVLTQLRGEGVRISAEMLRGLSPYRTSHINRFGDYTLDVSREVAPLEYATPILATHGVTETY